MWTNLDWNYCAIICIFGLQYVFIYLYDYIYKFCLENCALNYLFLGGALVIGQESIVYHDGTCYVAIAPPIIKVYMYK